MTTARLAHVTCPDFGMPDAAAGDPAVDLPGPARPRCATRASAAGYDVLVVYADREHSADRSPG